MTVVLDRRADITLEAVRRVAWEGEDVRLSEPALRCIADARAAFVALLADPAVSIYGVTTGYGDRASIRLTADERLEQARRGTVEIQVSYEEPLPERVVRAVVLARLANIVEGHAAVRPVVAEAVAAMLDGRPLPQVPGRGNGGAGEIIALAHLFGALRELGFEAKESLALTNGSPFASGLVADAALAARGRLALAEDVFALSAEAGLAPIEAYAPELDELWEDPHEVAALQGLRTRLAGGAEERRPYQAPVSYRILPRVLGQARRAVAEAERAAETSLRAVSDNPIFVPPTPAWPAGRILSNGSYHNAQAPAALDGLAGSWADLCLVATQHLTFLRENVGESVGARVLGMSQVAYAEEARAFAQRTPLPAGGYPQDDVASPSFLAWRSEEGAAGCLEASLVLVSAAASQALSVTGRTAPPALAGLLATIREHVPVGGAPTYGEGLAGLAAEYRRRVSASG